MRLYWYAGASAALATSVVLSAFHQRPNFYSAMVYLSQSSLCLMILANWTLLLYGTFMYGLQRLCYGALRPIEIEQLYEKAWFAVTETCLAMTIFRDEVGVWFLFMFTLLVTGKTWGWIGDGRVEVFEQQPPANPTLFHTRLSVSLLLSVVYDVWLLSFCISTVIQQARPNMMVMFLFEFAILTTCSVQTGLRYILSIVETKVNARQLKNRLEDRRKQVREEREAIVRRREAAAAAGEEIEGADEPLPDENDIDEMDIEVPGWEAKGQWILTLDLVADFIKLAIYTAFFSLLMTFYGLPIHIMRDLFMTTRSFIKRLGALLRYRQAVRDMNAYPDATAEELGRENTCIICREEMRPWDPSDSGQVERTRPKKLPCGHILHYGCLKSWLERQQVCPTCRRSVVVNTNQQAAPAAQGNGMVFRFGLNLPGGAQNQNQPPPANGAAPAPQGGQGQAPPPAAGGANDQNQQPRGNAGVRMFNFGPIRLGFAQGGAQDIQEMARRLGLPNEQPAGLPPPPQLPQPAATPSAPLGQFAARQPVFDAANNSLEEIQGELANISMRVQHDIDLLRNTQAEMQTLNLLVHELNRIRQHGDVLDLVNQQRQQQEAMAAAAGTQAGGPSQVLPQPTPTIQLPPNAPFPPFGPFPQAQPFPPFGPRPGPPSLMTRHTAADGAAAIPAGSADLPEGVSLPPGWSLLPLQRMAGQQQAAARAVNGQLPQNGMQPASAPLSRSNGIQPPRQPSTNASVDESTSAANPSTQAATEQVNAGPRSGPSPVTIPGSDLTVLRPTEDRSISALYAQPNAASTAGLPNWGGSAQLFATPRTATPAVGSSEVATTSQAPSALQNVNGEAKKESPAVADEQAAAAGQSGADGDDVDKGKGKGKAVTVEESADEEG